MEEYNFTGELRDKEVIKDFFNYNKEPNKTNKNKIIVICFLVAVLISFNILSFLVYKDHFKSEVNQEVIVNPAQVNISNNYQNQFTNSFSTPIQINATIILNIDKIYTNST